MRESQIFTLESQRVTEKPVLKMYQTSGGKQEASKAD